MTYRNRNEGERGSTLLMAMFVLLMVSVAGAGLLFLVQNESEMSQADVRLKRTYYFSEAGLEAGRARIFDVNKASADPVDLTEELQFYAGANGVFDFDPDNLAPIYDGSGNLSGFTGYGDDVPLRTMTNFAEGRFMTFVTNDPDEGVTTTADANQRVMLTSYGVGENNSMEMVRALVVRRDAFADLPSTITILGPDADFEGGDSAAKHYVGDEDNGLCPGGDPSVSMPVVGVIGSDSKLTADEGVEKTDTYVAGTESGVGTVTDLTQDPNLDDLWTDCELLVELAENIKFEADLRGNSNTGRDMLGTPGAPKVAFIEGDYEIRGNWDGGGLLLVTGRLTMDGMSGWYGPIFVIGKGDFLRDGAGTGNIVGGVVVADVAGPDRILFTDDDCSGEDGTPNTADDGVANSTYLVNGAGTSTTAYCGTLFPQFQGLKPFNILSFRQN